jgi:hypothetical protein
MEFDGLGDVAEIRGDGDFDVFGVEAETNRIDGVVRMPKLSTSISPTAKLAPA